jgi:hypothetical protein
MARRLDDWIEPEDWLYLCYRTLKYFSAEPRAIIEALCA